MGKIGVLVRDFFTKCIIFQQIAQIKDLKDCME